MVNSVVWKMQGRVVVKELLNLQSQLPKFYGV